jgi:hypothetical protein
MQRRSFLKSAGVLSLVPVSLKSDNIYRDIKIAELNKFVHNKNCSYTYNIKVINSFNKKFDLIDNPKYKSIEKIKKEHNIIGKCFNIKVKNNYIVCDIKLNNKKYENKFPCLWYNYDNEKDAKKNIKNKEIMYSFNYGGVYLSEYRNINKSIKSLKEQRGY